MMRRNDYHIRAASSSHASFGAYDSGAVTWTDALVVDNWAHVAVVKDGDTEIRYYVNGQQVGTPNTNFGGKPNTMPNGFHLNIGGWREASSNFKGYMSNVFVLASDDSSSAYSDNQMLQMYDSQKLESCAQAAAPPPAGAYGDPHCVNAKGDWFDIHAVGKIPMVILPFGISIERSDFAVIATTTTPDGWDKCAPTFISAVDVVANKANDSLRVDAGPAGNLQVTTINGSTEAYSIKMLSEKVMITFRSVIVSVILNKVPKIDQAPFLYFDMEVAGLQALKAGGILGADPHEFAQVQPDGCSEVPFKHRAVDRYSMARAMP